MNIFKWFKRKEKNLKTQKSILDKSIGNIKIFDDVFIKEKDNLFDGWVYSKNSDTIYVVYTDCDQKLQYAEFKIERPLNKKESTQNNITLII